MTEVVQRRIELMTEELEEMQRTKLFTRDETRIILNRRKEFEHKIHAITKELKSYTEYLNYEKCLLKDVRLRRDRFRIGEKKGSIEHKIIKRIKFLYEAALQRFPDDIPLFLSFLKFCKKVNYVNAASDAVSNMLKKHSDNPQIWHVAASWHAYDRKDTNTAMMLLLKGVAIHRSSQVLYKEMIQIELFDADKFAKMQDNTQQELCIKKLEKIITSVLENVIDCEFLIELLTLLEKHSCTVKSQEEIVEKLLSHYSDHEEVWHALAQREGKDIPRPDAGNESESSKKRTPKARLEACFAKYRQGLLTIPEASKPKLWALYLDFLLKLQQQPHGAGTVLKLETLKSALKEAFEEGHLIEKHYMAWLELMDEKEALDIAEKGTTAIPQSIELWKARLRLQIIKDTPSEVDKVFKLGLKSLKDKALPLWLSILRYHYLTSDDDFIERIYEDGVKQPKEISDVLKPQYIEWLALTRNIEAAREAYNKLAIQKPYCKELHTMMSKLESNQIDFNFETWGRVHGLACEQFGKEEVDVWINYIQFYLHYNKNIPDLNERIQRIRKQALDLIPKELNCLFETKYNMITASA